MCSVLQRPTPSAPNFNAFSISLGVSAFASTFNCLISSTQEKNLFQFSSILASTSLTAPSITIPLPPSREMISSLW